MNDDRFHPSASDTPNVIQARVRREHRRELRDDLLVRPRRPDHSPGRDRLQVGDVAIQGRVLGQRLVEPFEAGRIPGQDAVRILVGLREENDMNRTGNEKEPATQDQRSTIQDALDQACLSRDESLQLFR